MANIESTYYSLTGKHEPFRNLLLVDSFQLMEDRGTWNMDYFPEQYSELMRRQRDARIHVVMSNPPWFAWQENENLGIKAVKYEKLDQKIRTTYAAESTAQLRNSLYDSYIRAIRMATDRIGDKGVIAFVTNNGFLDGRAADGLRKCLSREFAKIYVLNLRGNARLSGEAWRREGGKIFEQGSRAGVALLVLVKDNSKTGTAEIYYHDIGDYLSREEKFERLRKYGDIRTVEWQKIEPNEAHDWINQRSDDFVKFPALASDNSGEKKCIFGLYSGGLMTGRDAWIYNFSRTNLASNMQRMISEFNRHVQLIRSKQIDPNDIESQINNDSKMIAWSSALKRRLVAGHSVTLNEAGNIIPAMYRPFIKFHAYFSKVFNDRTSRLSVMFPELGIDNVAICLTGPGNKKDFSTLVVQNIPDRHLIGDTLVFSLYTYEIANTTAIRFDKTENEVTVTGPSGTAYRRCETVTDWAQTEYRKRYGIHVTKEDIFYYVYALLHSPDYRDWYRNDLKKSLPRIPFVASAEDFWAFSQAGRKLADLHLHYETVEPWPVEEKVQRNVGDHDPLALYRVQKMTFKKNEAKKVDRTTIVYNEYIELVGIPERAYDYVVNGKSAIEWLMERYQVTEDKRSGIVNDPNQWMAEQGNPRYLVDLIKRVVRVSMETLDIVEKLPTLKIAKESD